MRVCALYKSGQFNGINYYYAVQCNTNTPSGMTSAVDLAPLPGDCAAIMTPPACMESYRAAPIDPSRAAWSNHTKRHDFYIKGGTDSTEGLTKACTTADQFPEKPPNPAAPDNETVEVISNTVVTAMIAGMAKHIRLILILHKPAAATKRPPLLIALGQETTEDATEEGKPTLKAKKYYTVEYGGLTYHVLLRK